jgi:hypothetical protein
MSNIEDVNIAWQDTGNIDAFGRARVSQLTTQFDSKQLHDNLPLFIDEELLGTATSVHDTDEANTTLSTLAITDFAISQTKERFNYQSGKSQMILMTCTNFEVQTDVVKRIGYFSTLTTTPFEGKADGLYFMSDGEISVNIYKTGTLTEKTIQSAWNIDKLDGTGESGITIDWSKNIIFLIDFEWLGVGRVRWGVVIDGLIVYFHESLHANNTTGVYMSSPNQPLRWEIRQNGATAGTFKFICASVNSEGSLNALGKVLSANLGNTHVNANSTSTKYAIIGAQVQASKIDTLVEVLTFTALGLTNDDFLWELWWNPAVTGTFTYTPITSSAVAIAKGSATGGNTVSGGSLLSSGYGSSSSAIREKIESALRLGMTIDGTLDTVVLSVQPLSSNLDILGSITWRELV